MPVLLDGCLDELNEDVEAAEASRGWFCGLQFGCVGFEDEADVVAVDFSVRY